MATTKKTSSKKSTSKKESSLKDDNQRLREEIRTLKKNQNREDTISYQLMPYVLSFLAAFLIICFAVPEKMGVLKLFTNTLVGLLSYGAYLIPVCLAAEAFFWKRDCATLGVYKRIALFFAFVISFSSLCRLWDGSVKGEPLSFNVSVLFKTALEGHGGGVVGGIVGGAFEKFTGIGAWIICVFAFLLCGFASFGVTPLDIVAFVRGKCREVSYNINSKREKHLKENIERRELEKQLAVKQANEKSAELEAKDAEDLRKRRAYIEEYPEETEDIENTRSTEESISDSFPESEIQPVLSPDNSVLDLQDKDNEAQGVVNIGAYDEVLKQNVKKRETLSDASFSQNNELNDNVFENRDTDSSDFSSIFTDDASIAIAGVEAVAKEVSDGDASNTVLSERSSEISQETTDGMKENINVTPAPTFQEIYSFPPINFLQKDPNPLTFTVTEELKQTSVKLVETLKNFGVKTKIMNICCGPTVTRYELQPEVGVRVRSIANLSDDIALHLAAAGVRIEAPIPGKDTVGIEIPNKTVSTVYLRNLIENTQFDSQKSRLTVCLGMDVAGTPIYMNIAKMPHLLIAGATGMGKSVCINSFIVSLLYKARPDEVKLILIDPKKVELSIYNGLPHLLVPVVSDPKKAAGTLAWAVNEMERRFLLIEEVGVRDLDTYNEVTKDDPEKEYLPKIVIIIDELADLMMTARVEVETSICRIAQKARAAGMHLVIGTQRPSVDVITGLIKANVPSRIAFTVASQIDSRTIIDVSGAEKLLGRGDMLYAPVGCMKPIRIQGSFVSEKEIENIVSFLKNGRAVEYDTNIIDSIEREAAKCGEKKKGRGGASGGSDDYSGEDRASILASDDAIFAAMEIAVESGSVSTSLLQRKLSLGYSRAARIVDKLEKLGVVGPFEGSKPRKVLITFDEYLEMRMNYEGGNGEE